MSAADDANIDDDVFTFPEDNEADAGTFPLLIAIASMHSFFFVFFWSGGVASPRTHRLSEACLSLTALSL